MNLAPDRFINRELSWLEFNERVLDQAIDPALPMLERAKFLAITSSNLDEFVMVRYGSLKMQYAQNAMQRDPAGLTMSQQIEGVAARCHTMVERQYSIYNEQVSPGLAEAGVQRICMENATSAQLEAADRCFHQKVLPVISPQALVYGQPLPLLSGLAMHLCVRLRSLDPERPFDYAIVPLSGSISRMFPLPVEQGHGYVLVDDLTCHFIDALFPGREVLESVAFRVTRNADVELREDEAADLMMGMEDVLESRRESKPIRLEYSRGASDEMLAFLSESFGLRQRELYAIDGPLDLTHLFGLYGLSGFDSLRDEAWPSQPHPLIDPSESMFENIANGDLLLIHPYEQFEPIIRMIEEAAVDPDVLAIKQVLYRTSGNSPIVEALMRAAERGKYVTVIVELKARFDEARNIEWAREMERRGVQVIYGIRGLKTHAKVCIIVRRQADGIVRYLHFGTGNYNEATAKLYGDVSLLTCDETLGQDATSFFTAVCGASEPQAMTKLAAAPLTLRRRILELIDSETMRARQGLKASITAKLNALVDTEVIDALYIASQAGVKVRLNIRGVCCLRPGVVGLSENIEVVSIIDRYLEHARVIAFHHGGNQQLLISSADWMPRNLDRRVELLVPVEDPKCQEKLRECLRTYFEDNSHAWVMQSNGSYTRRAPDNADSYRAQRKLHEDAVATTNRRRQNRPVRFEIHEPTS
ncbi:MAG: polyphosphate kinase 1 [Planctomycetota bacterium]